MGKSMLGVLRRMLMGEWIASCNSAPAAVFVRMAHDHVSQIYARIDGLNFDQLAQLADVTREQCDAPLRHVEEADVPSIHLGEYKPGTLFIIDEVENYWPAARNPLPPDITKWVAEHGHEAHDILLMGQEFTDMYKLWRARVSQRVLFNKLDMLGSGKKYYMGGARSLELLQLL